MNNNLYNRLIEISVAMKNKRQNGRVFLTSFAIRKNKIISIGWNNYGKIHPYHKFGRYYNHHKNFQDEYRPSLHAEINNIIKLGETDLNDYEICNIRISNNGEAVLSKPCCNCFRVLQSLNPKAVYYSTPEGVEKLKLE